MYIAGGGYSLIANSEESAENGETATQNNPYTTEYYDDGAKAPAVTSISIPASVEAIDPAFFQLFPNASRIEVAADSAHFTSYNGMLFGANDAGDPTDLLLVPEGMEGDAVLPETMATVPACVFSRCTKLSAIVVTTSSAGSAADSAFASQDGILYTNDMTTLLAAPAGLGISANIAPECTMIAEGAFWGNTVLRTIVVRGDVEGIVVNPGFTSGAAPADASADADIDTDVPAFEPAVIEGATVALTGDFKKGAWEAAGFTRFTEPAQPGATIEPTEGSGFAFTLLDDMTLAARWSGTDPAPAAVEIPEFGMLDGVRYSVSAIADDGFAGQTGIVTVDIPATVARVGAGAFANCTNVQTVRMGNGVRTLGDRAFANTALLSLVLPTGLSEIGAQAFAGLQGTTVVALHDVAAVADDALEGATGVNLYVPAAESSAWRAGLPAAGNHIYMYGVQLGSETLELAPGETAPLFSEDALQAPGEVQVEYAYKAKSLSISEDGTVEAKQAGATQVTATLTLPIQEVVVKGISSNEVCLEKASVRTLADTGAGVETIAITTPLTLASANQGISVAAVYSGMIDCLYIRSNVTFIDTSNYSGGWNNEYSLDGAGGYGWWSYGEDAAGVSFSLMMENGVNWDSGPSIGLDHHGADQATGYNYYEVRDHSTNALLASGELITGQQYNTMGYNASLVDVYVYFEWDVCITWDANGGSWSGSSGSTKQSWHTPPVSVSAPTGATTPTRSGYNFMGWATSANAATGNTSVTIGDPTTYYAVWQAASKNITINKGTGVSTITQSKTTYTPSTSSQTFTVTATALTGYNASKLTLTQATGTTGLSFSSQGTSSTVTVTIPANKSVDLTLTASLAAKTSALTFNINGGNGTVPTGKIATYGQAMPSISGTFTRDGYTFGGWWDTSASSGGTQYYTSSNASARTWNKNVTTGTTLYARWTLNTYTLSWNPEGGHWSDNSTTVKTSNHEYGSTVSGWNGSTIPERTGYEFDGWYDHPDYEVMFEKSFTVTKAGYYYAAWAANYYTVSFNANNGSGGTHPNVSTPYGSSVKKPTGYIAPTRAGYTLMGWYDTSDSSGGNKYMNADGTTTGCKSWDKASNSTLYARWNANTITITWNSNGGSTVANTSATYSSTAKVPMPTSNPTRAGYTFKGWFTSTTSTTQVTSATALPTSSTTYYAQWTANTITITWKTDADTTWKTTTQTYSENAKVQVPNDVPTQLGYAFGNWRPRLSDNSSDITGSTNLPTQDVTYYACWVEIKYFVDLNGNGATSGSMDQIGPITVTGGQFQLPKNQYVKTGYTFQGWSWGGNPPVLATDGEKIDPYILTSEYDAADINMDYELVLSWSAVWKANTYTVKFDGGEGATGSTADQKLTYGMAANLTKNGFEKEGHTFKGWTTTQGGTTAEYADGASVLNLTAESDGTVTLYAVWEVNIYVTFWDPNGGYWCGDEGLNMKAGGDYEYGAQVFGPDLDPNYPTRPGYTFAGWNDVETKVFYDAGLGELITIVGPATFEADWVPIRYDVAFDGNGAISGDMPDSKFWLYNDPPCPLPKNQYERTGYTFLGWALSPDATEPDYLDEEEVTALTTEDGATVTLYAVWKENEEASYTIEHYYQNIDGDFEKTEQTVPAKTGEEVALEPKPTATHYVLDGDARNVLTGTVKSDNSLTLTVYYLRWDCSVSYKWGSDVVPSGVELPSDDTTHLVGQTITVADAPTADGYTFSGWRGTYAEFDGTEMSGNELTVSIGEDRTFTMPNTDVTFTGTWTANEAKIVFEVNGGEKLAEIDLTGKTGETLASTDLPTEEQVKKVGWYLAGWYDNAELAGDPVGALPETFPAGTTTYYAKWSPVMSVTAPVSLTLGLTKSSDGVEGIPVTASFVSHTPVDGELSLEPDLSADSDKDGNTYADRLQNVRDFFTSSADNVAVQFADADDATKAGRVPLLGASQGTGLAGLTIKPTETRGITYSLDLDQVDARDVEIPDGDQAKSIALLRFVFALTE